MLTKSLTRGHARACLLLPLALWTAAPAAWAQRAGHANAAQAPFKPGFAISAEQVRALGVSLYKLAPPGAIAGLAYPARVILPPSAEQVISAPLDGSIDQLLVSGQERVRAGQPLLRLASPSFGELQVKLMEAASRARLSQKALARERTLFAEGIIAERRVQEAEAAALADDARLRQARAELRLAGADAGAVERSGRVEEALLVRARTAGVVLGIEVKPGQRVRQADALLRIADLSELWLDIQMPLDRTVPRGGEITIPSRDASAVPLSTGASAGESQTVSLRARVTRGAERLRVGETVQVQVPAAAKPGYLLPLAALVRQDGRAYIFVRTAQGFTAVPVEVLASAGNTIQVSGSLQPGQEVAVAAVVALKAAWLGKGGGQ